MSTDHHTPQTTGYALTAANDNAPLSELDSAITAVIGNQSSNIKLQFGTHVTRTIASGSVNALQSFITVDTEGAAASDDLDNITGTSLGQFGVIFPEDAGRTIVIKHATGNIRTWDGSDVTLDELHKGVIWINRSFVVYVLGYVGGGGGGGGAPNYSAGVIKTLSTDVIAAGSDRNLIVAAESGTTDDLVEVTGLTVGDVVLLRADSGDTITVKHNDGSATIKILLYGDADVVLDENNPLVLRYVDTNILAQDYDSGVGAVFSGAQITHSTNRSVLDSTATILNFDTENWDTDSYHDTVTNNSRVTIPETGRYRINVWVEFASDATGYRLAYLQLNGTTNFQSSYVAPVSGAPTSVAFTYVGDFTASDYFQVIVQQTSGGALNLNANQFSPFVTIEKIPTT